MVEVWFRIPEHLDVSSTKVSEEYLQEKFKPLLETFCDAKSLERFGGETGHVGPRRICFIEIHLRESQKLINLLRREGFEPLFVW